MAVIEVVINARIALTRSWSVPQNVLRVRAANDFIVAAGGPVNGRIAP